MKPLLILFLASGGVLIGLSIPLILRKVRPNPWYGFRVRRTLEDPNIWYLANTYSGWRMLWIGSAIMIAAVVAYFVPVTAGHTPNLYIDSNLGTIEVRTQALQVNVLPKRCANFDNERG